MEKNLLPNSEKEREAIYNEYCLGISALNESVIPALYLRTDVREVLLDVLIPNTPEAIRLKAFALDDISQTHLSVEEQLVMQKQIRVSEFHAAELARHFDSIEFKNRGRNEGKDWRHSLVVALNTGDWDFFYDVAKEQGLMEGERIVPIYKNIFH